MFIKCLLDSENVLGAGYIIVNRTDEILETESTFCAAIVSEIWIYIGKRRA